MKKSIEISQELAGVAPDLVPVCTKMPNMVPEGYFETLTLSILAKTAIPPLNATVPQGYFEALPQALLAKIRQQEVTNELEDISPLLAGISKVPPNFVPSGYFQQQVNLPESANSTTEAPVIPLHTNRKTWMWAAAAIAVLAGMFVWQLSHYTPPNAPIDPQEMASEKPLTEDKATQELATQLSLLEDNSLDNAFTQTGVSNEVKPVTFYLETDNFEKALRNLSDDDLKAYLENTSTDVHIKS